MKGQKILVTGPTGSGTRARGPIVLEGHVGDAAGQGRRAVLGDSKQTFPGPVRDASHDRVVCIVGPGAVAHDVK